MFLTFRTPGMTCPYVGAFLELEGAALLAFANRRHLRSELEDGYL